EAGVEGGGERLGGRIEVPLLPDGDGCVLVTAPDAHDVGDGAVDVGHAPPTANAPVRHGSARSPRAWSTIPGGLARARRAVRPSPRPGAGRRCRAASSPCRPA